MVLLASFQRGPLPSDFKIDGLLQPTADQYRGLVLVRGVCKLWNVSALPLAPCLPSEPPDEPP